MKQIVAFDVLLPIVQMLYWCSLLLLFIVQTTYRDILSFIALLCTVHCTNMVLYYY